MCRVKRAEEEMFDFHKLYAVHVFHRAALSNLQVFHVFYYRFI